MQVQYGNTPGNLSPQLYATGVMLRNRAERDRREFLRRCVMFFAQAFAGCVIVVALVVTILASLWILEACMVVFQAL